jgi:endonuclease YncB( thermonuclease family)
MIVTSQRHPPDSTATYHFTSDVATNRHPYTFAAHVDRVVDGDTLLVTADCGFHVASVQRLRLRGIDTPELTSVAGQRARAYVEQALGTADPVVLTTQRTDRYGRYLADVCYLPGSGDPREVLSAGIYLNRELLDKGLAWGYE